MSVSWADKCRAQSAKDPRLSLKIEGGGTEESRKILQILKVLVQKLLPESCFASLKVVLDPFEETIILLVTLHYTLTSM